MPETMIGLARNRAHIEAELHEAVRLARRIPAHWEADRAAAHELIDELLGAWMAADE